MQIKTIHYSNRDKGQSITVKNKAEYEFVKLNMNNNVKIIIKGV